MEDSNALKARIRALCEKQKLAVLATTGEDQPYANLVAFAVDAQLHYLLFATSRATRKFLNLQSNAKVALLIHDATNQTVDFDRAMTVTAVGTAIETLPPVRDAYRAEYLEKHPSLEAFVSSPDCALVRVEIHTYILVTDFQDVHILNLNPETQPDRM